MLEPVDDAFIGPLRWTHAYLRELTRYRETQLRLLTKDRQRTTTPYTSTRATLEREPKRNP